MQKRGHDINCSRDLSLNLMVRLLGWRMVSAVEEFLARYALMTLACEVVKGD
jgi:hypothetical protein